MNKFDEVKNNENKMIAKEGYMVYSVFAGENSPSFAYTVGLTETYNHPELLILGLPVNSSKAILDTIINQLVENKMKIVPFVPYSDIANMPIEFAFADRELAGEFALGAYNRNGKDSKILQVLWPDTKGNEPYSKEFEERFKKSQPLLFSW